MRFDRNLFEGKTVLVTGGTGSFGQRFSKMLLEHFNPRKIIIFSRDEMKQWEMQRRFAAIDTGGKLRYFVGDVRDLPRLERAFAGGVDYVVHAAALKIITTAEYNPFEVIKTNIMGAMNVIEASINHKVERIVALSTDKASSPVNLYGATKLCSDKLFTAANAYTGKQKTLFSVVRYGNVMGSRGSIIPFFRSIAHQGELPITDERMTRFMITLEQGVELVWQAFSEAVGGEIFVPKIPSMKVTDVARIIAPNAKLKIIGIRPGEKIHESMISEEDARSTFEYPTYFKILPTIYDWHHCRERIGSGNQCAEGFSYTSGNNTSWMSDQELTKWMNQEYSASSRPEATVSPKSS
ncbi:MAG: UDP-N-acetylglucosamine 4,6-dehydratase (inverting) [Candidatus Omnitrophica bacterium]|nr:UDP-N-acetylglucosamine 4,6-dehydratase (inverting) [Candidatus Omnitrophota bacterium]